MQRIDRSIPEKLYLQLAALIREQIVTHELKPGDRLPTEDQLCARHEVSKAVVRHAMEYLAGAGYIKKIAGKGTFVLRSAERRGLAMTLGLEDAPLEDDAPVSARVLAKTMAPPPPVLGGLFRSAMPRQVLKLVRLFLQREAPVLLETAFFSDDACPGLSVIDFRRRSLGEVIEKQCGVAIGRVDIAFDAAPLSAVEAEHLLAVEGGPATVVERTYYDVDEGPLGTTRAVFPAGRRRMVFELFRLQG